MESMPFVFVAHEGGPTQHAPNRLSVAEGVAKLVNAVLPSRDVLPRSAVLLIELEGNVRGREDTVTVLTLEILRMVQSILSGLRIKHNDVKEICNFESLHTYDLVGRPYAISGLRVSLSIDPSNRG
ncbi:MAG TPA: hypothetical protein PLV72_00295 [Candidatus Magasanikbacteria bacterium]|nr:hypothetical protein [Candidatus Magasanikbacteria bacterium]